MAVPWYAGIIDAAFFFKLSRHGDIGTFPGGLWTLSLGRKTASDALQNGGPIRKRLILVSQATDTLPAAILSLPFACVV